MRRLFYTLVLLAVLAVGVPALAQNDRAGTYTPIAYDETVTGEITDASAVQAYLFEGAAGDIIDITLTAVDNAFDPRLYLFTQSSYENGEIAIADDDDGGNGLNSYLQEFALPETGAYVIEATRFSGEGSYELTLNIVGVAVEGTAVGSTLAYGDSVEGEITAETGRLLYNFDGSAGDVISIGMTADDTTALDPYLSLYTDADFRTDGAVLAENDDFEGLNSRIDQFTLPEDGNYVIVASRFGGEGPFTLTLEAEGMRDMSVAQDIVLGNGDSAVSVTIPGMWQSVYDEPFTIVAESTGGANVFTANDIVAAPDGELTLAIASPEATAPSISEFTGEEVEATTEAYLAAVSSLFGVSPDLIVPYDGFAVPASIVVFPEDVEAPPNTVGYMVELDEGITWILAVTGGNPADFEEQIVEIVNSMAGIVPSFAQEDAEAMSEDMGELSIGDGLTVTLPDGWVTSSQEPIMFMATSPDTLEAFTGDVILNALDGELALAFTGPTGLEQIAVDSPEQTTEAYLQLIAEGFFQVTDAVESYDGFDFPASGVSLDTSSEAPENAVTFVVETDAGFVWIVVVAGGELADFEEQVIEIVNSLGQ